jgi:hypothetical protein
MDNTKRAGEEINLPQRFIEQAPGGNNLSHLKKRGEWYE